jgi:hypothetical protein
VASHEPVMVRRRVPVDPGIQGVCNRLRDQVDEIRTLERRLAGAKKRRVQLILKLRKAGLSLREIEPLAGMTNARISQVEQEVKRANGSTHKERP